MWVWTLNWDEIRTDILIGGCPMTVANLDVISKKSGATALLFVQHDECLTRFGIEHTDHA